MDGSARPMRSKAMMSFKVILAAAIVLTVGGILGYLMPLP